MSVERELLKRLEGRKIILFGASGGISDILEKLKGFCQVSYIVDNDRKKWGTSFLGYEVSSPQRLLEKDEKDVILICSWWKRSITRQLLSYGFKANRDFFLDSPLSVGPPHYFHIFETYMKFMGHHGFTFENKAVLHLGVGHTLMVDVLLALAGARVCACNLEDEMIFFPDASLKSLLYRTIFDYYQMNRHLFHCRPEDLLEFGEEGLHFRSGRISFLTFDAGEMPFYDDTFDYVLSFDFFEHVLSPPMIINEQSRVLKAGGRFFHHINPSEHRSDHRPFDLYRFSTGEWDEICKRLGYFHNRWLTCQFIEAFSGTTTVMDLEIHQKDDCEVPPLDQIHAAFRKYPGEALVDSTSYMRIGGITPMNEGRSRPLSPRAYPLCTVEGI